MNKVPNGMDNNRPVYTISVVAGILNLSVQSLRLYEREGLIIPFCKESKHRLYSQNDILRLQGIVREIKDNKFSLSAIKAILAMIPCWDLLHCSEQDRAKCKAYNGFIQPCWKYNCNSARCKKLDCKDCNVYNDHSQFERIKTTIKELTS